MLDEISVLQNSGTWELVLLLPGKFVVGCRLVFAIKLVLMVLLIVSKLVLWLKVIHKFFGLDYGDTFFPMANMPFVRLFIVMVALQR